MKYIRQLLIILLITFIGEILHYFLPLPVPASIYGMVLLFIALECRILKLSHVKETGKFLVQIMPIMFIPAGVGLLEAWGVLKPVVVPVVIIMVVTTIVVMGVAGRVTQTVIRLEQKKEITEDTAND